MTAPDVADLVERWWPLARGIARKWGARCAPWLTDDFESIAGEVLWKLARDKGDASPTFPGLVRKGVRWALIRRLQVERRDNPSAFAARQTLPDPTTGEPREALDLVAGREPEPGHAGEAEELAALLARARLTPRQRDVFERVGAGAATSSEIAAEQGVAPARIRQVLAAAVTKLRAAAGQPIEPKHGGAVDEYANRFLVMETWFVSGPGEGLVVDELELSDVPGRPRVTPLFTDHDLAARYCAAGGGGRSPFQPARRADLLALLDLLKREGRTEVCIDPPADVLARPGRVTCYPIDTILAGARTRPRRAVTEGDRP